MTPSHRTRCLRKVSDASYSKSLCSIGWQMLNTNVIRLKDYALIISLRENSCRIFNSRTQLRRIPHPNQQLVGTTLKEEIISFRFKMKRSFVGWLISTLTVKSSSKAIKINLISFVFRNYVQHTYFEYFLVRNSLSL